MEKIKFLVNMYSEDFVDEEENPDGTVAKIMTAKEIFNYMDMSDCFPSEVIMDIWRINFVGEALSEWSFRGCWHDPSDPLKMVLFGDGMKIVGYGTDH